MTSDALLVVQTVFSAIWRLFTSWRIPGTGTTPAQWFLFVIMAVLALRFLKTILPGLVPDPKSARKTSSSTRNKSSSKGE